MFRYRVLTNWGPKIIESCHRDYCYCLQALAHPRIHIEEYERYKRCKSLFKFPDSQYRSPDSQYRSPDS